MNETVKRELTLDSREVARLVEKRHCDLVRDIETYNNYLANSQNAKLRSDDFFQESTYNAGTGKAYKNYQITKKGCELIANKLTGKKGVLFTAAYVTRFNEMEKKEQPREIKCRFPLDELGKDDYMMYSKTESLQFTKKFLDLVGLDVDVRNVRSCIINDTKYINTLYKRTPELTDITYEAKQKTWLGEYVTEIKDIELLCGVPRHMVRYYLNSDYFTECADYYCLLGQELRQFKIENNMTSRATKHLNVITKRGFMKLAKAMGMTAEQTAHIEKLYPSMLPARTKNGTFMEVSSLLMQAAQLLQMTS